MNYRRASAVALNYEVGDAPLSRPSAMNLTIQPTATGRNIWQRFLTSAPGAGLYHGFDWQRVLQRAYGLIFQVALLEQEREPIAGCLLARSHNPFSRRLIALPFSDYCPPLSLRGDTATVALLRALARQGERLEIRGVPAEPPWKTVSCFAHWTLDLSRPFGAIEKSMDRNFKRQVRRAVEAGVTVATGSSPSHAKRFYALHLETRQRLGLPAPPWRFLRHVQDIFSNGDRFEVCLATVGGRDVAGAVLLKDDERLHCKWSARRADMPAGATHLLFSNFCERYAGEFAMLDLGRTDVRNEGLSRYKRELGAVAIPLPYAFYPDAPGQISPEQPCGLARTLSRLWRHLPMRMTRAIGAAVYGYLS